MDRPAARKTVLTHIQHLVERDPKATTWHLLRENLHIPPSEWRVRWVAEREGIAAETWGLVKARAGFSARWKAARRLCRIPRIRWCFLTGPRMLAFLNPVEIWLRLLVRKWLTRGNFRSRHDVRDQILAFIASSHRTMARPITWTDTERSPDRGAL